MSTRRVTGQDVLDFKQAIGRVVGIVGRHGGTFSMRERMILELGMRAASIDGASQEKDEAIIKIAQAIGKTIAG